MQCDYKSVAGKRRKALLGDLLRVQIDAEFRPASAVRCPFLKIAGKSIAQLALKLLPFGVRKWIDAPAQFVGDWRRLI